MKTDVVIIGINVEKYISKCIESVRNSNYPQDKLKIIFVDGGSTDKSVEFAKSYKGTEVIELKDPSPTPGKGRNAGIRASTAPFIQFLDADTLLEPNWLVKALPYIKDKTAAVCGKREELYPEKNNYHIIGSIEWVYEEGFCRYFGGDVLIRREALENNFFDENLVAGEDPDLSYRVREKGWLIYRLTDKMTTHDLNMNTFKQYFKRAHRSGHAYAEIGLRFMNKPEKMWLSELIRVCANAILPFVFILAGVLSTNNYQLTTILALLIIFRPFFRLGKFKKHFKIDTKTSLLYALHLSFVVYPQFLGVLRYFYTLISGNPLKNKGYVPQK
jgi:glycosyltransferase involved in cell wall biosynthesis